MQCDTVTACRQRKVPTMFPRFLSFPQKNYFHLLPPQKALSHHITHPPHRYHCGRDPPAECHLHSSLNGLSDCRIPIDTLKQRHCLPVKLRLPPLVTPCTYLFRQTFSSIPRQQIGSASMNHRVRASLLYIEFGTILNAAIMDSFPSYDFSRYFFIWAQLHSCIVFFRKQLVEF